jgi:hypothetical protein
MRDGAMTRFLRILLNVATIVRGRAGSRRREAD